MRYFVIGDDGQKYGPADVATLNQWISDGRLLPTTMLEGETSGERLVATSVPGLVFSAVGAPPIGMTPPAPSQGYAGPVAYPRTTSYSDNGSGDLTKAWIFCVLGLLCCPLIFNTLGYLSAKKAEEKGNPGGTAAKIVNIVVGILSITTGAFFAIASRRG